MKIKLSGKLPYNKTIAALSVLGVLSGFLTVLVGEIFLPLSAGVISALFVFEERKWRPVSIAAGVAVIALDVVTGLLIASPAPTLSVEIISIAVLVAFLFRKGKGKAETAFYVTALSALLLIVTFLFVAFEQTGVYTFASAKEFYSELYSTLKQTTVERFTALSLENGVQVIDEATIAQLFDSVVSSLVAVVAVVAFAVAGITLKVFSAVAKRISDNPDYVLSWRFVASTPVAYFFLGLVVISFFAGGGNDTFAITVNNLYTIFAIVFAYTGFAYLHRALSERRNSVFITLILVFGVLLFSSLAITLLSLYGVILTITYNKRTVGKSD